MIKVIGFRIKNYKSIKDSGYCFLANGIIVLAGKNESGKTSILEALEDFNADKDIREEAIPIDSDDSKTEIQLTFEIDKENLQDILKNSIFSDLKLKDKTTLTISKDVMNQYLLINSDGLFSKHIKSEDKLDENFKKNRQILNELLSKHNIRARLSYSLINKNLVDVPNQISSLKHRIDDSNLPDEEKTKLGEILSDLDQIQKDYDTLCGHRNSFAKHFKKFIPNFIMFDFRKDHIPNEISREQLENEATKDLLAITNYHLTPKYIKSIKNLKYTNYSEERKKQILETKQKVIENANREISKEYKKFWTQDETNLSFKWKGENLFFQIEENGKYYKPKQRSQGKQWHLAFYIMVTARSKEDVQNIILIDEPGLFLHAQTQKDILKKLEESSKYMPIIFSTHSSYLIDPNRPDRVRLVEKSKDGGTKITKITARAHKDTLTPILTAIGEDQSQGIRFDKKNSFVVEGISDCEYIHAFKKIIKFEKEIHLTAGMGNNTPIIASILSGLKLNPRVILDGDNSELVSRLKDEARIPKEAIIVHDNDRSIEEFFSKQDFKKFIDETFDLSKSIKKHLKESKASKELLAREFREKVDAGKITKGLLDDDTVKNIEALFEKIENLINRCP